LAIEVEKMLVKPLVKLYQTGPYIACVLAFSSNLNLGAALLSAAVQTVTAEPLGFRYCRFCGPIFIAEVATASAHLQQC
jgi:hypothetical protein